MRRFAGLLLIFLAVPTKIFADEALPGGDLKTANRQILAETPEADGIFVIQDDGSVHHIQSGLICPAKYANVVFYHVLVFARSGDDVGCDYRRADDKGGASAKLTIFVTKAREGMTLDQAFDQYRNEIVQVSPKAVSQGPALGESGNRASGMPEFRSEQYVEPLNGTQYISQLYVTLLKGWIIEIRATFVGLPNRFNVTKEEGAAGAVLKAGDRVMGPKALFDAVGTVGH